MHDRSYEHQQHRASGLNLIVAAIALWNTVHLDRVVTTMREQGIAVSDEYLRYLSPLLWNQILLRTGSGNDPRIDSPQNIMTSRALYSIRSSYGPCPRSYSR
jgi:hypothetical protein